MSDRFKSHYCRFCALKGFEARWVEVWETTPGPHSHLVCGVPHGMSAAFRASIKRSELFDDVKTKRVYDEYGLFNYLAKEMSSRARVSLGKPMRRGSYRLPGGGDRVRISSKFKRELIASGLIEPWNATNARRTSKVVNEATFERAQFGLFFLDELPEAKATLAPVRPDPSRRRDKIPPPSLPLAYPPSIADMLAGLAETHRAAADLVGLSRSQATNIINYQFNPSPAVAQRVLALAKAA